MLRRFNAVIAAAAAAAAAATVSAASVGAASCKEKCSAFAAT